MRTTYFTGHAISSYQKRYIYWATEIYSNDMRTTYFTGTWVE